MESKYEIRKAAAIIFGFGLICIAVGLLSGCDGNFIVGPPGAVGPAGPVGSQGVPGQTVVGPTGPQGPQGEQGLVGPAGPIGATGLPGIQGPIGETGATGPAGIQGIPGLDGLDGTNGTDGQNGTSVTTVKFCNDDTSAFPEYGLVIGSNIYAVYWGSAPYSPNTSEAFLALIKPGSYVSTGGNGCSFTVNSNGSVSP